MEVGETYLKMDMREATLTSGKKYSGPNQSELKRLRPLDGSVWQQKYPRIP